VLRAFGVDEIAEDVYQAMVRDPGLGVAELCEGLLLPERDVRAALDRLAELSLLRSSRDHPGELYPVSPDVGLTALMRRKEAELARQQQEIAAGQAAVSSMVAEYAAQRDDAARGRLVGLDRVQTRLEQLAESAVRECLSVMPGGAQSAAGLAASRPLDRAALERGVSVRTLYQESIRNDAATLAYAHWLLDLGGEVRVRPVLPPRLVVVDAAVAIVPLDPEGSRQGAVEVRAPGVVAALIALFEQTWQLAAELDGGSGPEEDGDLTGAERELLLLLADGLTDQAAAKRLGVSLRTVRRMMAELMRRLGATSRFAAGMRVTQRGWL
jgi:DNA-binding CsgD family transcriptional regulator